MRGGRGRQRRGLVQGRKRSKSGGRGGGVETGAPCSWRIEVCLRAIAYKERSRPGV